MQRHDAAAFPTSPLSNTHRSEFVFNNPNAKGVCGCGESFTTDTSKTSTLKPQSQ